MFLVLNLINEFINVALIYIPLVAFFYIGDMGCCPGQHHGGAASRTHPKNFFAPDHAAQTSCHNIGFPLSAAFHTEGRRVWWQGFSAGKL